MPTTFNMGLTPTRFIGSICAAHPEAAGVRRKANRVCVLCARARYARYCIDHKDSIVAKRKIWNEANRAKKAAAFSRRWDSQPTGISPAGRAWRENHPEKIKLARKAAKIRRERLLGGQAISNQYRKELLKVYRDCPTGMQVDHIVPLRGKNVCGLHIPINLAYLTPEDNWRKSNKHESDDWL